jgi:hypothetical protein
MTPNLSFEAPPFPPLLVLSPNMFGKIFKSSGYVRFLPRGRGFLNYFTPCHGFLRVGYTGSGACISGETPPCHFSAYRARPEGGNFGCSAFVGDNIIKGGIAQHIHSVKNTVS